MKKIVCILLVFALTPLAAFAQLTVPSGGTGTSTIPTNYILIGNSALRMTAVASSTIFNIANSSVSGLLSNIDWTRFSNASAATSTFSAPLLYNSSTNAVTCVLCATPTTTPAFPIIFTPSTNAFGLAFGTTTTNTWSGLQVFTNTGTTSHSGPISATYLNLTGAPTATSTSSNGLDLSGGCFSISGTCLSTIISSGSAYKQAAVYASTSTLPSYNYSNGASGVGATITSIALQPFYIDGNTPSAGQRVLIKNETGGNAPFNGIYNVTTVGITGLAAFVLTRATDYNSSADVFPGVANFVNSGTVNANTCWVLTNTTAVTIGTTNLTYDDACGAGSFTGGTGITVSGTTISVNQAAALSWSALELFQANASTTGLSVYGPAYFGATATSSFDLAGKLTFTYATSTGAIGAAFGYFTTASTTALTVSGVTNGILGTSGSGVVSASSTLGENLLTTSGVSAGSYTNSNITVNAQGFVTSAANGSAAGAADQWTHISFRGLQTSATTSAIEVLSPGILAATSSAVDYASSTAVSASGSLYAVTASTTNLTVSGVVSALHLGGASGIVSAYGGSTCTTHQYVASINGAGVASCSQIALSTDVSGTLPIGNGGTGTSTWLTNSIPYFNGTRFVEDNANLNWVDSRLTFTHTYASSTAETATTGYFTTASTTALTVANTASAILGTNGSGVVSSALGTPWTWSALNNYSNATSTLFSATTAWFATASTTLLTANNIGVASTTPGFAISVGSPNTNTFGSAVVAENKVATTSSMTIDWKGGNQQLIQMTFQNMTIGFNNASTTGQTLRLGFCNLATSGTVTFTQGIHWPSGTAPIHTTTSGSCDWYGFFVTAGTSTAAGASSIEGYSGPTNIL